jgi:hypothetical protein
MGLVGGKKWHKERADTLEGKGGVQSLEIVMR